MAKRVLVVDDEEDLAELLSVNLAREGFRVETANSGREALAALRAQRPDLLILDLMLPDLSGLELCRRIRADEQLQGLPILMLTAKADEVDRIVGFELGADDYVTKPFSPREVSLRVRALLRRADDADENTGVVIERAGIALDPQRHRCTANGHDVTLTATEFRLLEVLMTRAGRVQTREQLLAKVWGSDISVTSRTVDTHIKRLREKLGDPAQQSIETVRGVGYRFVEA